MWHDDRMAWDPHLYLRFDAHRFRPALDLLDRIDGEPKAIVDLGCGTGAITAALQSRWPQASVIGVDNSLEMLTVARSEHPGLVFEDGDIEDWEPARAPDLIYSNAALQWLDRHDALFPALLRRVAPGGILAVQMPRNHEQAAYRLVEEICRTSHWTGRFEGALRMRPVGEPEAYYEILAAHASSLDIWETEYLHALTGPNPVATWLSGSFVRPVLAALGDEADEFRAEWSRAVAAAYPPRATGVTLFPFRRLFIVARRSD